MSRVDRGSPIAFGATLRRVVVRWALSRAPFGGALFAWVCGWAGCADTPTQVLLHVDAEATVRSRAHTLCVAIESDAAPPQEQCARVAGSAALTEWPTTVPVLRAGSSTEFLATFTVYDVAEAARLAAGEDAEPLSQLRVRIRYRIGEVIDMGILLEDACIARLDCAEGTTCIGGTCAPIDTPADRP